MRKQLCWVPQKRDGFGGRLGERGSAMGQNTRDFRKPYAGTQTDYGGVHLSRENTLEVESEPSEVVTKKQEKGTE